MFLWVAGAAAAFGIAAVLSFSLVERLVFNQKVINAKNETIGILKDNNEVIDTLKENVRVLNTNQALNDTPRLGSAEPLSVILDALPAQANSSALGASLQQKLLQEDGVSIDTLTVDPISGVEDDGESSSDDVSGNEIGFQFTVSTGIGQADSLRNILRKLETSIRVIDLTNVTIEQQSQKITLSATGKAYYQPEKKVELKTRDIKP